MGHTTAPETASSAAAGTRSAAETTTTLPENAGSDILGSIGRPAFA